MYLLSFSCCQSHGHCSTCRWAQSPDGHRLNISVWVILKWGFVLQERSQEKKKYPEGKTAAVANAVVKPPPSAAQVWDSASIKQQDADKCDTCSFNYHHCYCCDYTTVMRVMRADMSKVWLWDQMWHLNRFYLAMTYFSTNNSQLNWY